MKMRNRWSAISLVILSVTFGSATSFAEKGWGDRRGHGELHLNQLVQRLDLSEEQKNKIREIEQSRHAQAQERRQAIQDLRQSFHEAAQDPSMSEEQLRQMHERLVLAQGDMMRNRFEHMLKIRAVLDDEQRQAFRDILEDRRSKHHIRRGKRSE